MPILVALSVSACDRGCAWGWLREHGIGGAPSPMVPGAIPLDVIDCPDGIARCAKGNVEVSRLARIPQPCRGPESACTCPWERIASCGRGCVAEEVELVIDRAVAASQLCAAGPDSGLVAHPTAVNSSKNAEVARCEEGELYRCTRREIVDCVVRARVASCAHGCFSEGASLDIGTPVDREAAFAILCSR